ncbi:MAG: aminotransferase class V-fold PLP-dependent enzyme [Cyclobacteriaceae bacterium]
MLSCQKDKFSIPADIHYLNGAYMSPMLKSVEEAGIAQIIRKRNPSDISAADFFTQCEELRVEFSKIISDNSPDQVSIIPSVSYGIENVIKNIPLKSGDEIVVLGEQFPSNIYPWKQRCVETGAKIITVEPPEAKNRGEIWNQRILEAINKNTRIVAMCHVHWTDGTLFRLSEISKKIHENDGYLILDGTQSVGAYPFDVNEIKPDALICAGYKWLLGPYSIGAAYFNERFNEGDPIEHHWLPRLNSKDFAGLVNYQDEFEPGAKRYDVGERSNFILMAMIVESMKQINQWGVGNIQGYCQSIAEDAVSELPEHGYNLESREFRGSHLFGIRLGSHDPRAVAEKLNRDNIKVSVRGSAVRVSPYVYNTSADIEELVECLKSV